MAHTLPHSGTKDSAESGQKTEKWGRVTSEHCGGSIEVLEASNPLDIRLALRSDPVSVREGNKCFRQHFDFIVEAPVQPPSDTAAAAACVPLPPTLRLVIENAAESMCPFDGYTATIRREYPDTGPGLDGSTTSDAGVDASPSVGNGGEQHRHRADRAGSSAETAAAADWGADSDAWQRVAGTELISLTHPHRTALVVNVDTAGASRMHVAYFPPYRYDTQHARLMEWCASQFGVTRGVAATSLDSRAVDLITINRTLAPRSPSTAVTAAATVAAAATTTEANPLRPPPPRTIWIVCRQHPAETMAEWWAEGFLRRLLEAPTPAPTLSDTPTGGGPEAESEGAASDAARDQLLAGAVVHVVPCANPKVDILSHNPSPPTNPHLSAQITMGFAKGFTITMHLVLAVGFIAILAPEVYWAKVGEDKISLWKNCSSITGESNTTTCSNYGLKESDMKDEHKALLDGTRASCVMAALFAVLTFAVALCDRKFGAVITTFLAAIFATTALGCFVVFMKANKVDWEGENNAGEHTYKPSMGLIISALGLVISYFTVVSACCITRSSDYESIA
eukprot:m.430386 g.430386  ORF g.430386 m.430386 type:complete len:566 (+) comp17156_c0_seq1:215-1912(+)